jgi:hypothetical protein
MREAMDLGWRASSGAAVGRLRRRPEGGGGGREGGGSGAETAQEWSNSTSSTDFDFNFNFVHVLCPFCICSSSFFCHIRFRFLSVLDFLYLIHGLLYENEKSC